jgi:hypothetical protein
MKREGSLSFLFVLFHRIFARLRELINFLLEVIDLG